MKLFINLNLLLFLSFPVSLSAQVAQESIGDFAFTQVRWFPVQSETFQGRSIKSFLFEEGVFSNVLLESGQEIKQMRIRYDLTGQMMHFFTDEGLKAMHRNAISSFIVFDKEALTPRIFKNSNKFAKTEFQHGFLEVLADGSAKLLRGYFVKLEPQSTLITLGGSQQARDFEVLPALYIQIDQKATRLPSNKKAFLALFGGQKKQMEEYIRSNKLRFKNLSHLKLIIAHYNGII